MSEQVGTPDERAWLERVANQLDTYAQPSELEVVLGVVLNALPNRMNSVRGSLQENPNLRAATLKDTALNMALDSFERGYLTDAVQYLGDALAIKLVIGADAKGAENA